MTSHHLFSESYDEIGEAGEKGENEGELQNVQHGNFQTAPDPSTREQTETTNLGTEKPSNYGINNTEIKAN